MPVRRYTPAQYLEAVVKHGGDRQQVAREFGVGYRTVWSNLKACEAAGHKVPPAPYNTDRLAYLGGTVPVVGSPHNAAMQAEIDDLRGQLEAVTTVKRWAASKPRTGAARKPRSPHGRKHFFLPDCQVKCGVPLEHLTAAGNFVAEKKPDVIVCIGDFADMPSLSSWDRGKMCFEGRRYRLDIEAAKAGMERFLAPIRKVKGYNPEMHFTAGNHEYRIDRAVEEDSRLEGLMSMRDLKLEEFGWTVHPFLKPVVIDGVAYAHFFPRAASGKVMQSKNGAPNALAQLRREARSCAAGHVQGLDLACLPMSGRMQFGIQAGSYYMHDEGFLTEQGNDYWRGVLVFHEVCQGSLSPLVVSLDYLLGNYL